MCKMQSSYQRNSVLACTCMVMSQDLQARQLLQRCSDGSASPQGLLPNALLLGMGPCTIQGSHEQVAWARGLQT